MSAYAAIVYSDYANVPLQFREALTRRALVSLALISVAAAAHAAAPLPSAVQAEIDGELKECTTHNSKFKKVF